MARKLAERKGKQEVGEKRRAEAAEKLAGMSEEEKAAWREERNILLRTRRDADTARKARLQEVRRRQCRPTGGPYGVQIPIR